MEAKDSYEVSFFINAGKKKADTIDPNVINDALIKEYIKEYNAENKIFGMDDMPFYELLELRLSFQNILKIQNLRSMDKLKKLCLDNNIIAKIEKLDYLPSLEWLDLSFNNISEVEGLDNLTNLTDLSLFHNNIKSVTSGLSKCTKLNVLSLGDNKISVREPTIAYLRGFQHLQVLKMEGNDIYHHDSSCKAYIYANMPQLKYLDYMLIDIEEVKKAREEFRDDPNIKENQEQSQDDIEKELAKKKRLAELKQAFISKTDDMLKRMMELCPDEETKIKVLPGQADSYDKLSNELGETVKRFQENIIKHNEVRLQMVAKFENSVRTAEDEKEAEDIRHISEYEREEKRALRAFEGDQDEESAEEGLRVIYGRIDELENVLIDKELQLVERINEAIDRFEKMLKAVVETIKEEAKTFQEESNKEVESYFGEIEKVRDEQMKLFSADNPNVEQFTSEQREVYAERDLLNNAISTLVEEYKNMVFRIEEKASKGYDEQLEKFVTDFKEDKHNRNRNHIREIMELVQDKRKKIDQILENS